jgi:hypothetical protein
VRVSEFVRIRRSRSLVSIHRANVYLYILYFFSVDTVM